MVTAAETRVFKGRPFDRTVIRLCVRWYLAYNLSLRSLEEMMAERGISVDHATVHRWVIRYTSELLERSDRGQTVPKQDTEASWSAQAGRDRRQSDQS
jgi:transposase-like protein